VREWTGEGLRRAVLERLGEHVDARAREAVVHGSVAIVPEVARWVGSGGPVAAHRVSLAVDARTLGGLRAAPAAVDALCAAFAAVVASRPGEALQDLVLRWTPAVAATPAGYRDARPETRESSLEEGLRDYLGAYGEPDLARLPLSVVPADDGATVHAGEALRGDPRAQAVVAAALRDLLGDSQARVRLT
jgi:hypothetical protein